MRRRTFMTGLMAIPFIRPAMAQDVFETRQGPVRLETVAKGLDDPWSLTFLPDGRMLVTERTGRLRMLTAEGKLSDPVAGLPEVSAVGQGGLLDVALHPQFTDNRLVFLSFAEPREGGNATAVMRGRLSDDAARLSDVKVIWQQQPATSGGLHFGSRLVFDRSGALFVTTGDRNRLRDMGPGTGTAVR